MLTSIAGRVAVVTGGRSGIGRGIANVFARQGAKVLVVARDAGGADAAASEIVAAGGGASSGFAGGASSGLAGGASSGFAGGASSGFGGVTASGFGADVASEAGMQAMAETAIARYGGIDILCANAGIFPASPLARMTGAEWDEVLDTNLKGLFLSLRACLPALKRSTAGRVIITSSITGPITGYPGWTHYAASKAGQLGFMRTAAIELAPHRITVNAVLPGNILTEGLLAQGEDYLRDMAASIPLRRLGKPDEIGNAALFLASDEAAYITGQTIVVDGGQTLPESLAALDVPA